MMKDLINSIMIATQEASGMIFVDTLDTDWIDAFALICFEKGVPVSLICSLAKKKSFSPKGEQVEQIKKLLCSTL